MTPALSLVNAGNDYEKTWFSLLMLINLKFKVNLNMLTQLQTIKTSLVTLLVHSI